MTVLDIVCRDPRITRVTLIEPDIYKPHNVERHLFPPSGIGARKADLAAAWLKERRPDLRVELLACDLLEPIEATKIEAAAQACDIGVCAADNEPAKFHFDALMRKSRKPWTLGEVLSGGIGGFVHWFVPGGPCYGCVASFLRRSVKVDASKPPDYSAPGGPGMPETTIPASRASIEDHRVAARSDHAATVDARRRLCAGLHELAADAGEGAGHVRRGVSHAPLPHSARAGVLDLP